MLGSLLNYSFNRESNVFCGLLKQVLSEIIYDLFYCLVIVWVLQRGVDRLR